jgi:hypothetical protein
MARERERERTNGTVRQIGYILEQKHSWSPPLFVRHRPLLQDADERQEYLFNTINDTRHYIPFCYYRRASITALFPSRLCNMRTIRSFHLNSLAYQWLS